MVDGLPLADGGELRVGYYYDTLNGKLLVGGDLHAVGGEDIDTVWIYASSAEEVVSALHELGVMAVVIPAAAAELWEEIQAAWQEWLSTRASFKPLRRNDSFGRFPA